MKRDDLVWSDRKRNWLGLPWTFTVYGLTEDRLFIKTGSLTYMKMRCACTGYWICP